MSGGNLERVLRLMAEKKIRIDGIVAGVLQIVGVNLLLQSDASAFLPKVD